jgi:broad specificity phosphatase PhoE
VRLLLVRHGESTWNAQGRYQGRMDPPLSERGLQQAGALAQHLATCADSRPAAIVASPLARARRTADIVANRLGLGIHCDDRLIEISHGEWEGLLKSEVEQRWPDEMSAWRSAPQSVTFPHGESLADVHRRWCAFLDDAGSFFSPLLIVTHDVIVRLAVLDAKGEPAARFNSLASENAAITELCYSADGLRLVTLNHGSYLGALKQDTASQAL